MLIKNIVIFTIFSSVCESLINNNDMKKLYRFLKGLIILIFVLSNVENIVNEFTIMNFIPDFY